MVFLTFDLDAHAYCLQLRSHGPLEALHCELCGVGGVEFCEYINYGCAIGIGFLKPEYE